MKLNLSKIFNIKPNGGGYKTLKKLMGKYNIPIDEIKDIKKNIENSSSSGSKNKYAPRYFSIDWNKASEEWLRVFDYDDDIYRLMQPFATIKSYVNNMVIITSYGIGIKKVPTIKAFSYIPCCNKNINPYDNFPNGIHSFEQCIEAINILLSNMNMTTLTLGGITEITEEEYYKID